MQLVFEQLEKTLSAGKLYPVYFISGEENYLVSSAVQKIKDVYQAETGAEVERFTAKEVNASKIIDSLNTLPMWSKGKLVIIGDAGKFSVKNEELFAGYTAKPSASAVLVFTADKFDKRKKLYKSAGADTAVVEIKKIYDNQLKFWIQRMCKDKGVAVAMNAAEYMAELIGANLSSIADAIEKIILFIGKKKMIDLVDVEKVLSDTSQRSVFELTNAIGEGDKARAVNRLTNLLRNNESPVLILNMVLRHWNLLIKVREMMDRGARAESEILSSLGVNPFFAKEYISQAKRFKLKRLVKDINLIWDTDKKIKSSPLPKGTILNKLIMDLTKN